MPLEGKSQETRKACFGYDSYTLGFTRQRKDAIYVTVILVETLSS